MSLKAVYDNFHIKTNMDIMTNKNNTAKYRQIADLLIRRIDSGEFRQGELIPPEMKLSEEFSVSRVTMRNALSMLVNDGYLSRRAGKGTAVASRESKFSKLRNGMNFGIFVSAGNDHCNLFHTGLTTGLGKWGANLCVFPFLPEIDQAGYVREIIGKNIVDGVFLSYFGEFHQEVVSCITQAKIPILETSTVSHYENIEYRNPVISIDEVSTLREKLLEYKKQGINRIHLLGMEKLGQLRRMKILFGLAGVDKDFEFIEFKAQERDLFSRSEEVIWKSVNRSDTLIFISGDELLPYFDAAMRALASISPELLNLAAYLHFETNPHQRWTYLFSCFDRPYFELGLKAAEMMQQIIERKENGLDYYRAKSVSVKSLFVPRSDKTTC